MRTRTAVQWAPPVRDLEQAAEDRITVEAPARPSRGQVAPDSIPVSKSLAGALREVDLAHVRCGSKADLTQSLDTVTWGCPPLPPKADIDRCSEHVR
jgi:hypothetical protein